MKVIGKKSVRLTRAFFARDTIDVARDLLGCRLVHLRPDGRRIAGIIVETEAYLGVHDPACHSFGGRQTPRTQAMYADAGTSYVYLIYGLHHCFNVSTVGPGVPEAVLVRALEMTEGSNFADPMRAANGPGKLCSALAISRAQNGLDLASNGSLFIESGRTVLESDIVDGPRVGLGNFHDAVHWPLRFGVRGHASLSPARWT